MVSYEVSIGLTLISVLICVGSLDFVQVVFFQKNVFFFRAVSTPVSNVFG